MDGAEQVSMYHSAIQSQQCSGFHRSQTEYACVIGTEECRVISVTGSMGLGRASNVHHQRKTSAPGTVWPATAGGCAFSSGSCKPTDSCSQSTDNRRRSAKGEGCRCSESS